MLFDPFESIVLFLSVSTVNFVLQDGKSNWLKGLILICLCVLTFPLAIPLFVYPLGADVWHVGMQLYYCGIGLLVLSWKTAGWAPYLLGVEWLIAPSASGGPPEPG